MASARRVLDLAMSETYWQDLVRDLARTLGYITYHTHDSKRSNSGFPDLVLVGRKQVIFAELKAEHGKLTQAQALWQAAVLGAGAKAYVCRPSDYPEVEQLLVGPDPTRQRPPDRGTSTRSPASLPPPDEANG